MKKLKSFYQKHIYSKSELYLSLIALCLSFVVLIISLMNLGERRQVFEPSCFISPLGIGSNLPNITP